MYNDSEHRELIRLLRRLGLITNADVWGTSLTKWKNMCDGYLQDIFDEKEEFKMLWRKRMRKMSLILLSLSLVTWLILSASWATTMTCDSTKKNYEKFLPLRQIYCYLTEDTE